VGSLVGPAGVAVAAGVVDGVPVGPFALCSHVELDLVGGTHLTLPDECIATATIAAGAR
jgi:hypothetical protein